MTSLLKRRIQFILATAGLCLAGCGGSTPATHQQQQQQTQPTTNSAVVAGKVYCISPVTQLSSNIDAYPANFNGTAADSQSYPIATTGPTTGPVALTVDQSGNLYVFVYQGTPSQSIVQVFAPGAATPSRTITLNPQPTGTNLVQLAIDTAGNLYVAMPQTIYVYAAGATGTVSPARTITGYATLLNTITQMAFDSAGNLYVATSETYPASEVVKFSSTANGNIAPTVITAATYFPTGIALDASDNIYISQGNPACGGCGTYSAVIAEFPKGSVTGATPTRTISGSNIGVAIYSSNLFVDAAGNIFLQATLNGNEDFLVFSATATGNLAPASTAVPSPAAVTTYGCIVK